MTRAREAFRQAFGEEGFIDTTGLTGRQVREGTGKAGTYHFDYEDTQHGGQPHLQVHDAQGRIFRLYFPHS